MATKRKQYAVTAYDELRVALLMPRWQVREMASGLRQRANFHDSCRNHAIAAELRERAEELTAIAGRAT